MNEKVGYVNSADCCNVVYAPPRLLELYLFIL